MVVLLYLFLVIVGIIPKPENSIGKIFPCALATLERALQNIAFPHWEGFTENGFITSNRVMDETLCRRLIS